MSAAPSRIDHLVVVSPGLDAGCAAVAGWLGVAPEGGGAHPHMGTHNRLLRLGDHCYLEVIAIDPAAPPPARARWFGLDRLAPDAAPRLATWVAATPALDAALAAVPEPLGRAEAQSRGPWHWRIALPDDGEPPLGGVAPALIEWPAGAHPAPTLPDRGCRLVGLDLWHPAPARLEAVLAALWLDPGVPLRVAAGARPALRARIETPRGPRTLGAAPAGG
ncbi:VOC family protein [Piscinibacter sakaiensis]|uniref:Glyoxalase-like domain-containing protein n=1 Tax=Piscinibacter sakaiensis TaxID=1547922 RepID=A0A0K8P6B0_PISS1|nr:VOC family protein [Piscinibacter sakaiensis]GAP38142.1 hypothetical protein ISF6_4336 [Piscinibacter sakaiensis]